MHLVEAVVYVFGANAYGRIIDVIVELIWDRSLLIADCGDGEIVREPEVVNGRCRMQVTRVERAGTGILFKKEMEDDGRWSKED